MSSSTKAAVGAMGSKAARACDGCLRRRARWYCAADDAFLCQGCDTSVHSANPLARRHGRVRLRPSASSPPLLPPRAGAALAAGAQRRGDDEAVPAWFKRKARTPRGSQGKSVGLVLSRRRLVVPEAAGGDSPEEMRCGGETDEEEEELLYRVPIFDPALGELCSPLPPEDSAAAAAASCCNEDGAVDNPTKPDATATPPVQFFPDSHSTNFSPTDAELMKFAADMEALLGRGLDEGSEEDSFCMETLGLMEPMEVADDGLVKLETDGEVARGMLACGLEQEPPEVSDEMLDIDFDYAGSPQTASPDENAASSGAQFPPGSLALNLNYEAIIDSWESSPWADGERPRVKLEDCWPHDYSVDVQSVWMVGGGLVGHGGGEEMGMMPRLRMGDGGREARVSRYREKRRTRLFSKKIRYEVRKLNAEKRPRMKGRFVKRSGGASGAVATACVA